jgi:phosphate transport system substrate-binding protein
LTPLVSVQGSNTMTELLKDWADAFMKLHPDIPVSVTSDDSGSGIKALINQTTDLAAASRDLTSDEDALIAQKREHLRRITVARDAIVVLVNPGNPVDVDYFQQHVLKGRHYAKAAMQVRSSNAITQAIEKQPWAIGYEGLGYSAEAGDAIKILKLKLEDSSQAVAPTPASTVDAYPLSRPLIIFVDKESKPSVGQFVDFLTSDQGQKIVRSAGYVPIK